MSEPTEDLYPSQQSLARIAAWSSDDLPGLFAFIEELWYYPHCFRTDGRKRTLITGGWSGNESLIAALGENNIVWLMTWQSSNRGGRHVFEIPKYQVKTE